jgi:hypothetical protein
LFAIRSRGTLSHVLADSPPQTIDDAELTGWIGLAMQCRCGRTELPWPLVRRRTPRRVLADIAARLVCHQCGQWPSYVALTRREPAEPGRPLRSVDMQIMPAGSAPESPAASRADETARWASP